jgi:hypothetical protein
MKERILFILAAFLVIASCSKSSDGGGGNGGGGGGGTNCSGVASAFAANVNPIIQSTCATDASCHGTGSANGPGPLLTYTQIFNARVTIKAAVASGTMPKVGSLTTLQKNTIICWIDGGAPNN